MSPCLIKSQLYKMVKRFNLNLMLCCIINTKSLTASFNMSEFINMPHTANSSIVSYTKSHLCPSYTGHCCECKADFCMKEKTCCIDTLWSSKFISRQDEYIRSFLDLSRQYKNQECSYTIPKRFVKVEGEVLGYYMVTTCQDNNTTKEIRDKCSMGNVNGSTMEYYIPVKDKENYFYRNKYCAICNSVTEFKMASLIRVCGSRWCQIRPQNPEGLPCRPNSIEVNKTCSRGNKYYDLCRAFSAPVGNHANYFCYLCNGGNSSFFPTPYVCKRPITESLVSWSSLLRFDYSDKKNPNCKSVEVLDGKTQQCSPFVCPTGYQAQDSKCVASKDKTTDSISIEDASFDKCLQTRQPKIIVKDFSNFMTAFELFSTDQQSSQKISLFPISNNLALIDGLAQNKSIDFMKSIERKIKDSVKENETIIVAVTNPVDITLSPSKVFPNNSICADPISLNSLLNFTDNCDAILDGERISFSDLSLIMEINKEGFSRTVYICKNYHLSKPCPRKILYANQTTIDNDKSLIYIEGGMKRVFQVHEYEPYTDGRYTVCIDTRTIDDIGPWWFPTVDKVAGYVSIIGASCSILSLIILISTILRFKELQNVPGLCTLALSINLFIADVLFLTVNLTYKSSRFKDLTTLCDIIGVLIHFFLLSAQIWGLVMAVDISINLTKSNISNHKNKRKFIWFNFAPVLVGALLITIALLFRDNNILDVSYNKDGKCILHGFYSRIYLFFLPFLICFFVSSTVLSISIGYIAKERRKHKNVLEGSTQNKTSMVKIALKLVVVCGLAEGVGIINIPTGRSSSHGLFIVNSIFILLYSFVKGFRGVLLFIVYVCRKPVYDMYHRKYKNSGSTIATINTSTNNNGSMANSRNDINSTDSQL